MIPARAGTPKARYLPRATRNPKPPRAMLPRSLARTPSALGLLLASTVVLAGCPGPGVTRPGATTPSREPAPPRIIPAPVTLATRGGAPFRLDSATTIVVESTTDTTILAIAEQMAMQIRPATGFRVGIATAGGASSIRLRLDPARTALGDEGYELTTGADGATIVAMRPAGLFYGTQTLRQLLPTRIESQMENDSPAWLAPAVSITDRPRFAWRGAMLDVARHFFTVKEVEQYIDLLAMYKLNVLHLHLSDDQGWRIQIDSRPALTSVGSRTQVGGGPGGFYTKADYGEIVRYAAARFVTVVPEIDMPGHTNAALTAYPALSCSSRPTAPFTDTEVGWSTFCVDNEETYALVDDIVREIAAMTPGPYFHMGGDEVMKLTHEQYVRFVERVQTIVQKHGKRTIGWEEIGKARLLPTTIAQQWKSDSAVAAVQQGSKLIMSPATKVYLDMKHTASTELGLRWAAIVEVRDAYDWDPATYMKGVTENDIVGVEAPMWSETVRNIGAVNFLAVPRLPAIAELAWTPQQSRRWEDFRGRAAAHAPRWNYLGVNFYRSPQIDWP